MSTRTRLDEELERRLTAVETVEAADPAHARLGARTLTTFLVIVVGVVAVSLIGVAL